MTMYRSIYRTILLWALVTGTWHIDTAAAIPPAYRVTELGTLGGFSSFGNGINASGQVTGLSYTAGDAESHAFLYDGTMHDLGTLGGPFSSGLDINGSGQVAGTANTTREDTVRRAFLYDGVLHDLGTLGGTDSSGSGINNNGQVTGDSATTGDVASHAFLYDGTMHDLGTLGGTNSAGRGINDSGQVTGFSDTTGDAETHAFLWTPTTPGGASGVMHDLGTLGGTFSVGTGINDGGQVTGYSQTIGGAAAHAFLYDGTLHDLGTLGGTSSLGFDVNSIGQVIGFSDTTGNAAEHAFLYTPASGMIDLNSLIDPLSGWELLNAIAINDAGQITGTGLIGGQTHAFLLTPVPEPASLALLAIGLPFLVVRNSRRSGSGGVRGGRRYALAHLAHGTSP